MASWKADMSYNNRRLVANLWAHLKEWRAIHTHYKKTPRSSLDVACVAAMMAWFEVVKR
jgi:hypothetical protein